jgi:primary-amine oxidase
MQKLTHLAAVLGIALTPLLISQCSIPKTESSPLAVSIDPQYAHPILVKQNMFTNDHYFSFIKLQEPAKAEVLAYQPGQPFQREALASVFYQPDGILTEIRLDLKKGQVLGVDTLKGMQPVGLLGIKADSVLLNNIMAENTEWVAALKKRGISIDSVTHSGNPASDMGMAPAGHREMIIGVRYKNKKYRNLTVGGLYAFVDLTDKKILKIIDEEGFSEPWNVNYFKEDSARATIAATKPLKIQQPEGVTFNVKGHEITWNNWRFRYGISNREGLIIYQAAFNDNGKWRSVMYRGSMPEMVVNYGSPDVMMASNNFFDVGVYRLGQSRARPMTPGADAPENALYLSTVLHNDTGKVMPFERAVAVYEEFDGPLWRHNTKGVHATNLAVKYFTTIGNYDYAFKWVFRQDGTIDIVTELNGIVQIRGVNRTSDMPGNLDANYEGSYYGTLVDEHVEAVNHQHFFVYRLDMDVDGINNTVGEMNTLAVPDGPHNLYKNTMVTKMTYFKKEQEAQRSINVASNRHWKVMNHDVSDQWGHHSAYMLMPSAGVKALVNEGSSLLNRAGFLHNHLWVTPLNEREIYPAGDYPASNLKKAGLPSWTAQNREIENKDVVLWYVAGVTHIVRLEEWPIMAPHYIKFSLMPFGFFSQNPTVTMPPIKSVIAGRGDTTRTAALDQSITQCDTPGTGPDKPVN